MAAGLVLFALAGCFAVDNILFLRTAAQANGEVVSNREERSRGKGGGETVQYYALIRFVDQAGVPHQVEPRMGETSPLPLGTAMPVLYPPEAPARGRVGGSDLWDRVYGFIALGLFFLACGSLLVFGSRCLARWGVPMRR
ncbi:MAG: DUF3592 domain-containing protein [Planctomycetales bacterium]